MDAWIEANIFVQEGKQREVLLTFIKPLVQRLRSEFHIKAYHFLHEPDNEIRFRVLTTDDMVEKIKGLIENARRMPQVREVKYPPIPYPGEREGFGEDGWITTYRLLEAGSDFALDSIDPGVRRGPQFNPIAFSHYFLNQFGYDQIAEASFHASVSIERMVTWVTTILDDRDRKIGEKIAQLEARVHQLEQRPIPAGPPDQNPTTRT